MTSRRCEGEFLGLHFKVNKCELVCRPDFLPSSRRSRGYASILGAPLFKGNALDDTFDWCCLQLIRTLHRLKLIQSRDALVLLIACFNAIKEQHLLICSPYFDLPALPSFDPLLSSGTDLITICRLADVQWLQAGLPTSDGWYWCSSCGLVGSTDLCSFRVEHLLAVLTRT